MEDLLTILYLHLTEIFFSCDHKRGDIKMFWAFTLFFHIAWLINVSRISKNPRNVSKIEFYNLSENSLPIAFSHTFTYTPAVECYCVITKKNLGHLRFKYLGNRSKKMRKNKVKLVNKEKR